MTTDNTQEQGVSPVKSAEELRAFENWLIDTLCEWTDFDPDGQIGMILSSKLSDIRNNLQRQHERELVYRLESMADSTQELDEILAKHGAEPGEMTHSLKQAILDWHNKQIEAVLDRLDAQSVTVLPETHPTGSRTSIDAVPLAAIAGERAKLKV